MKKSIKRNPERIGDFLNELCVHPKKQTQRSKALTPTKKKLKVQLEKKQDEVNCLKHKLKFSTKVINEQSARIDEQSAHLEKLESDYDNALQELDEATEKLRSAPTKEKLEGLQDLIKIKDEQLNKLTLKLGKANVRNVNKKLKRRDEKVVSQSEQIRKLEDELAEANKKCIQIEENLDKAKRDKRLLQKRVSYFKRKTEKSADVEQIELVEQELTSCYEKIQKLKLEKRELEDMINFMEGDRTVTTFHEGRYSDNVREVYMKLLNLNIGRNNVESVIRTVLQKLANLDIGRLPSRALTSRLFVEAKCLADIQVASKMLEDQNATLHYDETTKFGDRYGSLQVTTASGSYVCGLFDMDSGTSERLFEYIQDCIKDLAKALDAGSSNDKTLAKLVFSFINTMTDRHITNSCVDEMLVAWRNEIAPKLFESFDQLSDDAKHKLTHVNSFKCNLHFLIGLATEANKALITFEDITVKSKNKSFDVINQAGESGTVRTIRTVCKAFEKHGSEEAGVMVNFAVFLKNLKCKLTHFRGNRFNVVFWNGAGVYFHKQNFADFFEVHGTPNRLLRAVKEDLSEIAHIAGARALGIIDKLVTGPLWRLVEKVDTILDLNEKFQYMQSKFREWAEDATPLLFDADNVNIFNVEIHKDDIYTALFSDSNDELLDSLTIEALELILHHFNLVVQRQLSDHLVGGTFDNPSDELKKEASHVPKSNQIGESIFGSFDRLIRERPNATTLNLCGTIQYIHNKTGNWLNNLDAKQREEHMQRAREAVTREMNQFKDRKKLVQQRIQQRMLEKQQQKMQEEQKRTNERRKAIADVTKCGGEWSQQILDERMATNLTENEKRAQLLSQIKYHKIVLKTPVTDKSLLQQQRKGKVYTNSELTNNLRVIIQQSETLCMKLFMT